MIRGVFNFLCSRFFALLFVCKAKANSHQSIYIFDIDNTLGHTYPTLLQTYPSEKQRLLAIPFFSGFKKLLEGLLQSKSRKVLFLTARSYKSWFTTRQWLSQNGIETSIGNIIIVQSPAQKIELLQKILPHNKAVYFIDDMTWNHEKGDLKFYEPEIQLLSKLPVRYIGYKTIKAHQQKH